MSSTKFSGSNAPPSSSHASDSLLRHLCFSSEVPQELPNIIEGVPSQDLELAANSLMRIQILISPKSANVVPINELQCQYLSEKLCDTLKGAKACIQDASLQHVQELHDTLKILARLAKEAEKLVHDCCDAEWIQAAMIFGNAKEHFASLTFKLRLYMELLQSNFKEGATKEFLTKLQDRKWIDDVKHKEFHCIDEKAKKDRQRLLSRLTQVRSSDSENLIKRLKISSDRATFLQENVTDVMNAWKVEYKSIHRVPNGQIGKGVSATVHKVTWLGKDFAEKCFHGPENEAIRKEASLLAGLSHPNILPLFCYATEVRRCSLVMELMDEDLYSLLNRRMGNQEALDAPPFKHLEAVDIMLQVAEGMNYLHQNRVVHRDLKSMNILVKCNEHDRHVHAKVADFGLSKIKELSCTSSEQTMDRGTTRWMAPELFGDYVDPSSSSESLKYHFKVDVYSFGMVCCEILTGYLPFGKVEMKGLRKSIKDGLRPDIPKQCPEQLSTMVQACYDRDPNARPSFPDICVELRHIMCSLMGPVGPMTLPEGQQHPLGTSYLYGTLQQSDSGSVQGTYAPYIQGSSAMGVPAIQPHNTNSQRDTIFPERPGQPECYYYMKTGDCKLSITCMFHHPKDRFNPSPTCILTPMGLPLRPGARPCGNHYGICKDGPTCKFDHPLLGLTYSPSASSLTDMPVAPYPTGLSPTALGPSPVEAPHEGPSSASSFNEPTAPSEEHPGLQQLRDGSDPSVVSVSAGAPTTRFVNSSNNFRNGKQKGQPGGKSRWCETHGLEVPKKPGSKPKPVKTPEYSAGERATVDHLLRKLTSSQPDMQRAAAGELRLLAKHNVENRICIADAGAIPLLVGVLSTQDLKTQEHSVTALLNLSINDNNKGAIVNAGAINPIVEVLKTGSKEARENAAATLFSLSVVDENKISIGNSGAIPPLVDLLKTGTSRGKKDAATALFNLSIYQGNKARAVRAGVVAPLLELLEDANAGMVDEALAILAILATHQEGRVAIGQASAIPVLVDLIHSGSSRNKENAAAVLLALMVTDPANIEKARELGAYAALTDLAINGTTRAKRKATQLLEHMRKQEGQSIPLASLDVSL